MQQNAGVNATKRGKTEHINATKHKNACANATKFGVEQCCRHCWQKNCKF